MKKILLIATALFGLLAALPAQAALLLAVQGEFSGSLFNPDNTPQTLNFTNRQIVFLGVASGAPTTVTRGGVSFDKFSLDRFGALTALGPIGLGQNFDFYVGQLQPIIAFGNASGILFSARLRIAPTGELYFNSLLSSAPIQLGQTQIRLTSGRGLFEAGFSVPETSTWAMFILGFGLIGMGARRRPTAVLAAIRA